MTSAGSPLSQPVTTKVVVCGGSATGLQVARTLGRCGCDVAVADVTARKPAFYSCYCTKRIEAPASKGLLAEAICDYCREQTKRPVLVPCSDEMVEYVANHREILDEVAVVWESLTPEALEVFLDKQAFACFCSENGFAAPQILPAADLASESAATIQWPLLLKPRQGHQWRRRLGGRKVVILDSFSALAEFQEKFGDCLAEFLIQELVPGPEDNIWVSALFTDHHGCVQSQFVGRKLRQHPRHFGSASLAESCWNDEVAELSRRMIVAAEYRGFASTEFKFDTRDQKYKAIEVNPRPSLWWGLISSAGVPLVETAISSLIHTEAEFNESPAEPKTTQRDGVRWSFFEKDVVSGIKAAFSRDLGVLKLLISLCRVDVQAVLSWRDIMPGLFALQFYVTEGLRRRFSNSERKED